MHIGLNLVFLVPGATGGLEVFARELLAALPAAAPGARFTAFVGREAAGSDVLPATIDEVVVPVHSSHRVEWVRGEQLLLPRLARRCGVDVLHSLASTAPVHGRYRRVVTVHDLNYRVAPGSHFGIRGMGMRVAVPLAVRRAHRVIAISRATRDDLIRLLRVDPDRVEVVYPGRGAAPAAALDESEVRARFDLPPGRPVLLTLSAKRPHKNLTGLLRALAQLESADRPICVMPGYVTPHEAELRLLAQELGIAQDVRWLGWIGAAEVEGLFAIARAFAFPSFAEGFGLPMLEAMARGVPVVCSDCSCLPEVAGDAAVMFEPGDPADMARAIRTVLQDDPVRARLRDAGLRRARQFTWERAARETVAVYKRVL